jgi:hypothetical protein
MMRRCSKCFVVRSVVLTVYGRHPLHFCASCARIVGAKYRPALPAKRIAKPLFNAAPLLLKRQREMQ